MLLIAVIGFCGVAGKVLLADYKRLLVNGLNLGQPSFVYAYLALLVQSGALNRTKKKASSTFLSNNFSRFSTIDWVSWCLKTIGEIAERILAPVADTADRRRNLRRLLDVQIGTNHAGIAANA